VSTYNVTQVADGAREWKAQNGTIPMKSYRVTLKNEQGAELQNVEWSRKAESPPPQVGQQIDATIDMREGTTYGPKLKLEQRGGGGGGGYRADSPEVRRSIAMQHAQKCAVSILEVAAAHGEYTPPSAGDVAKHVTAVAAVLFAQVVEAEAGS
jgi:hypothetical protein